MKDFPLWVACLSNDSDLDCFLKSVLVTLGCSRCSTLRCGLRIDGSLYGDVHLVQLLGRYSVRFNLAVLGVQTEAGNWKESKYNCSTFGLDKYLFTNTVAIPIPHPKSGNNLPIRPSMSPPCYPL